MSLTAAQCRAARALIGWSQDQLSKESKVAKATIANFETGNRTPYDRTLVDIQAALQNNGVVFLSSGELVSGGEGVRLHIAPVEI